MAVLADIARRDVTQIVGLGDFVGYGADPGPVLDLALGFDIVLPGNHELALVKGGSLAANPPARKTIDWTRERLGRRHMAFLQEVLGQRDRRKYVQGDFKFVHGSPRRPAREYVRRRNVQHFFHYHMHRVHVIVVAHTHHSRCWFRDPQKGIGHRPEVFPHLEPVLSKGEAQIRLKKGWKYILNCGAVGQPRDGDPRASYIILQTGSALFVRVPYDCRTAAMKIREAGFDERFARALLPRSL